MPSQVELGRHLDLSSRSIRELIAKGVFSKDASFDEARVAYIRSLRGAAAGHKGQGDLDLSDERARLASEQADAMALKNAELRGELVRREDTEKTWSAHIGSCRTRLRAIPKKLIVGVPGFTRSMAVRAQELIDEALHELSGDRARGDRRRARTAVRKEDLEATGDASGE